ANKVITNQNELVNNFNIVSGDQFENKQNIIDENKTFDDSEFVNNKDRVSKKITTKDIVIICPSNIDIFYNRLRENLKKISMLYNNEKIIKYPYANVLFTACCIFCKKTSFINEEEYINFVQVLLEVNHIRAKKIFKETLKKNKNSNEYSKVGNLKNSVEYRQADMSKQEIEYRQADMSRQEIEYRQANISKQEIEYKKADDSKERIEHIQIERLREIFNYIKKFRNSSTTIYEFMTKFYIEYMLNLEFGKENVKFCKQIIFESMDYTDQIHSLEWDKHKTKEEIFIEVYKSVLSNDISKFNVDELIDSDNILICTPSAFVNHKISRPIRILVDLSSNNWTDKIEKELTNKVAFVENFDEKPFTKEMENDYIISDILDLTYEILDGAESIYSFQSEYSINGFVQSSVMSTVFQRIYDKNQK
ncbi:MAG: hypothetical protein LBR30_04550, partial [Clostridioides sp.]|nr:hypothetical protein [Clostridioides sp.]